MRRHLHAPARTAARRWALVASAAVVLGVPVSGQAALPAAVVKACPGADALPGERSAAKLGATTVCLVNGMRTARGLPKLRMQRQLTSFARAFARRLVHEQFFAHDVPGGPTFAARARSSAYAKRTRRMSMGENLAWGSAELATPASIVGAWMRSPGHRANVMRRAFRDIGLGVVVGAPAAGEAGGVAVTYVHAFGWRTKR